MESGPAWAKQETIETTLSAFGAGSSALATATSMPKSVLDRRYAAGEISREDYQRMRDDIDRRT